jgi:anthranilate synthase component 1
VHDYIRDGDVFQVNLSRLWQGRMDSRSANVLYENLRQNNPAPFAGFMHVQDGAVLSSSPERLVSVRQNRVETRPIAGTRPRGADSTSDESLQKELIAHPKERAEHVMLIDLERNDLGRICKPGSVQVNENMTIESYAHVHHIVSNITGQLRDDVTPVDVIRAVFPGGTITGCPKVRCMEIIGELEKTARGAYTGSMGYIGHDGSMDLNILIRSIVVEDNTISFRAGAGLVADSIPEKELHETRAKAKGMLMALNGGQAIAD